MNGNYCTIPDMISHICDVGIQLPCIAATAHYQAYLGNTASSIRTESLTTGEEQQVGETGLNNPIQTDDNTANCTQSSDYNSTLTESITSAVNEDMLTATYYDSDLLTTEWNTSSPPEGTPIYTSETTDIPSSSVPEISGTESAASFADPATLTDNTTP
jgi:hypothetical protein